MEIGSEFASRRSDLSCAGRESYALSEFSCRYFLSGRTCLHFVGQEIRADVSEILLPAYCCGSMVAPFAVQGFEISFYNPFHVKSISFDGDPAKRAIVLMDYFGFLSEKTEDIAAQCRAAGMTVIIDATQTAFSVAGTYALADYIIVSFRKWFDCLCAAVYSRKGFRQAECGKLHTAYTGRWRAAAELKHKYLTGEIAEKQEFLERYAQANHLLDEDFFDYAPDEGELRRLSTENFSTLRQKRRENAAFLMEKVLSLSANFDISLMFDRMKDTDCPLFVPILLNESQRAKIRSELTQNDIYCPIHWPIDTRYPHCLTEQHQRELSLVCDQRYGIAEMERQITVLTQALQAAAATG